MLLFYSYTWSQLQMARRLVILETRRPETREGQRLPKVTQLVRSLDEPALLVLEIMSPEALEPGRAGATILKARDSVSLVPSSGPVMLGIRRMPSSAGVAQEEFAARKAQCLCGGLR